MAHQRAADRLPQFHRQRRAFLDLAVALDLGALRADALAPVHPFRRALHARADGGDLLAREHAGYVQHHILSPPTRKKPSRSYQEGEVRLPGGGVVPEKTLRT